VLVLLVTTSKLLVQATETRVLLQKWRGALTTLVAMTEPTNTMTQNTTQKTEVEEPTCEDCKKPVTTCTCTCPDCGETLCVCNQHAYICYCCYGN
jgi:hypothetical protein